MKLFSLKTLLINKNTKLCKLTLFIVNISPIKALTKY